MGARLFFGKEWARTSGAKPSALAVPHFCTARPPARDAAKAQAVQELFEQYNKTLQEAGSFPPLAAAPPGAPAEAPEPAPPAAAAPDSPQTRVWVLYFLVQHYDYLG